MSEAPDPRHMSDEFGNPIGISSHMMSRWFKGEPTIAQRPLRPVRSRWLCPQSDCDGEMIFNGESWPTGNPGYHHTCNKCGFTAAIRGATYPSIEYLEG